VPKKGKGSSELPKAEVKQFALSNGADRVGVASVGELLEAALPEGRRPGDILPGARSLITFYMVGIPTPRLTRKKDWHLGTLEHSLNFVLLGSGWPGATQTDLLAYKIARFLMGKGYEAMPIPSGHPYDKTELRGIVSHKHAAVVAGLGEIGLNQLLITPEFGCNVYPASVLTTAFLAPDKRVERRLCEGSREACGLACVSSCPSSAIHQDGSFDKRACVSFLYEEVGKKFGYPPYQHYLRCGVCMNVCPAREPAGRK